MGNVRFRWAMITERGLAVQSTCDSLDEWRSVFNEALGRQDGARFALGDLWNMRHVVGDEIIEELRPEKIELHTIQNYAWVAKNWPYGMRDTRISFTHHEILAPLEVEDKIKWIGLIVKHHLTTQDLRDALDDENRLQGDAHVIRAPLNALLKFLEGARLAVDRLPAVPEKEEIVRAIVALDAALRKMADTYMKREKAA